MALFAPIEAQKVTPPLKWAGGKRWLVPHLEPLWAPFAGRRLVEPFCGGLAVSLGLMPGRALLNDANVHAINFYRWLQRGLHIDLPMSNDVETFYLHRAKFNALIADGQESSADAAALFYYLNRTCRGERLLGALASAAREFNNSSAPNACRFASA